MFKSTVQGSCGRERDAELRRFTCVFQRLNPEELSSTSIHGLWESDPWQRGWKNATRIVSVWLGDENIVIEHMAVDEKSNEITAIPKMLNLFERESCYGRDEKCKVRTVVLNGSTGRRTGRVLRRSYGIGVGAMASRLILHRRCGNEHSGVLRMCPGTLVNRKPAALEPLRGFPLGCLPHKREPRI